MSKNENMIRFLQTYSLNELRAELDRQKYIVIRENNMPKIISSLKKDFFYGLTESAIKFSLKKIGVKDFGDLSKSQLVEAILSDKKIEESIDNMINSSGNDGFSAIVEMFFMKIDRANQQDIHSTIQKFYEEAAKELGGEYVEGMGVKIKGYALAVNSWDNRITIYEGIENGEYVGWVQTIMEVSDVFDFIAII